MNRFLSGILLIFFSFLPLQARAHQAVQLGFNMMYFPPQGFELAFSGTGPSLGLYHFPAHKRWGFGVNLFSAGTGSLYGLPFRYYFAGAPQRGSTGKAIPDDLSTAPEGVYFREKHTGFSVEIGPSFFVITNVLVVSGAGAIQDPTLFGILGLSATGAVLYERPLFGFGYLFGKFQATAALNLAVVFANFEVGFGIPMNLF